MQNKVVEPNFIKAVQKKYNFFTVFAGAMVIVGLVFILDSGIDLYGKLKQLLVNPSTQAYYYLIWVFFGLLAGFIGAWLLIKSFSKKAGMVDGVSFMGLIAAVVSFAIKAVVDFDDIKVMDYIVLAAVIALFIVLLIIHKFRYKSIDNCYVDYSEKKANSNFITYYKQLFKCFNVVFLTIIGILSALAVLLLLVPEDTQIMFEDDLKKYILIGTLGLFFLSYIIGLIFRLKSKRITLYDVGIFVTDIVVITGAIMFFIQADFSLIKILLVSITFVLSLVLTIILMFKTYVPTLEEEIEIRRIEKSKYFKEAFSRHEDEDLLDEYELLDEKEELEKQKALAEKILEENQAEIDPQQDSEQKIETAVDNADETTNENNDSVDDNAQEELPQETEAQAEEKANEEQSVEDSQEEVIDRMNSDSNIHTVDLDKASFKISVPNVSENVEETNTEENIENTQNTYNGYNPFNLSEDNMDRIVTVTDPKQTEINENIFKSLDKMNDTLDAILKLLSNMPVMPVTNGVMPLAYVDQAATNTSEEVSEVQATEEIPEDTTDYTSEEGSLVGDSWIEQDYNDRIKPKYSFEMKMRIADDDTKRFYSDIKNELLSYGIRNRISRHRENFNKGRLQIARMVVNGKTLKVYLAIDPNSLDASYYHHKDVSDKKGVADLPTMINVRSKVAARKVKELIEIITESLVIKKKKYEEVDFAADLTIDGYTTIQCKGFDYMVKEKATLEEVRELPDHLASQFIEVVEDETTHDKYIKTKITIDQINANFEAGEIVDIQSVKAHNLASSANANYLIIKEGESLEKKLKVFANEYTPDAVKEICISGGEAFMVVPPTVHDETAVAATTNEDEDIEVEEIDDESENEDEE